MLDVGSVGVLGVIMISDEQARGLGFFFFFLQQVPLLNQSCDFDHIFQCVGLLDFYVKTSSRRPVTKHPMRKLSGRSST